MWLECHGLSKARELPVPALSGRHGAGKVLQEAQIRAAFNSRLLEKSSSSAQHLVTVSVDACQKLAKPIHRCLSPAHLCQNHIMFCPALMVPPLRKSPSQSKAQRFAKGTGPQTSQSYAERILTHINLSTKDLCGVSAPSGISGATSARLLLHRGLHLLDLLMDGQHVLLVRLANGNTPQNTNPISFVTQKDMEHMRGPSGFCGKLGWASACPQTHSGLTCFASTWSCKSLCLVQLPLQICLKGNPKESHLQVNRHLPSCPTPAGAAAGPAHPAMCGD